LYKVAAHDGLENAKFQLHDHLKKTQAFNKDNIANDKVVNKLIPNPKKLRAMFELVETNNVKKIEKLLERNNNLDCRRELIRHRFLNRDSLGDNGVRNPLKNHLRKEVRSYNKSSAYQSLVRKNKLEMYKHRVNVSMKGIALDEYRDMEKFKQIPHFNSLYKQNQQNIDDRMDCLKKFRAFYDVCQEVYDSEKDDLKQFNRNTKKEMEFLRGESTTWKEYNQKIDENLMKDLL
jgi:hypothetical protein